MFLIEKIKEWRENRAIEQEYQILEKKKEARWQTILSGFVGFVMGAVGTLFMSAIFYLLVYFTIENINESGEIMSTISTIAIGYNLPMYLTVLLGVFYMSATMIKGLWIFLKFIFISAKDYDLEYKVNLRG